MKILIVEDQTMFRDMLVAACEQALPGVRIAKASDGAAGLEECRAFRPDLVILDLELPDADGLDLLPGFVAAQPGVKVIALSSYTDEFTLHRALESEVHGFVDKKEQPLDVLKEAIEKVTRGERYFSSLVQRVRASLRADPNAFNKVLTSHQQVLLGLIGLGLSNEEIGEILKITPVTVKNHRRKIMAKLDIHGTPRLIRYAVDKGFTRFASRLLPKTGVER